MMRPTAVIFFLVFLFSAGCASLKDSEAATGTIPAGKLQIYYQQKGEGEAILLIHAGLQNSTMWEEQVKELSKNYKVVTIDLPFHGNTTGVDTAILAKDVVKTVLDSLHLQKVSVAGLSMGASVVQDFIIAYPERVNKVFLISAGINGYDKKFGIDSVSMVWYTKFAEALHSKDTARAALEFTKAWGEGINHRGDSLTKPASRYVFQTTLATLKQHKMEGWPNLQEQPPALDGITGLKMPVLIIHGDQDLPFITTASLYMEKNIPGARRVLLKGAAHMLNMEQPTEVNQLMMEFLRGN